MTEINNHQLDTTNFWTWFDGQRGSISVREVERRAKVPSGRIGNARSGNWRPTFEICQSVATGLRMPVKDVLKKARMVPTADPDADREETLILQFRRLPVSDQRLLLEMIQALVEKRAAEQEPAQTESATLHPIIIPRTKKRAQFTPVFLCAQNVKNLWNIDINP